MADKKRPKQKAGRKTGQIPTKEKLTPAQARLLEVLLDPANRLRSVTDVCQMAEITRDTYYQAFKRPMFVKRYEEQSKDLALRHAGPVMNAFVREATRGSFQHGKVILEMAGLYTPKEKMELTGKDGGPIKVQEQPIDLSKLTDAELVALEKLVAKAVGPDDKPPAH